YHEDAAAVAARTVDVFADAEHVVVPSGSCAWMVKAEYPGLLAHDARRRKAAGELAARTRELSQFLVEVLGIERVESSFERTATALQDRFLQQALTIATTKFIDLRKDAFAGFPQGDALRDQAQSIKEATLQKLDVYLGQLADNVERLGGHVHWASSGAEAR